ncbi:haloalkane dehalogenase [Deinococcus planocerae]|uniref:haloalkane dehalogenase n=1 Tax=Deinococcus planocerae TaxID=1737569 RepID=UPI000C7F2F9C|nr:haloalkane dehalogenase [Deinococcus planocerae]
MTDVLRTPDDAFRALPGYPFAPHYLDDLPGYEGLRLHHLDEGPRDAETVFLCLHGQPTWSYLYRRMIPVLTSAGHRVVAPDLLGFGRSDKPADDRVYTFDFHRESLLRLIQRLDLRHITLVVQDWGGLLGLTLPLEEPGRFSRLIVMNTALATGDVRPNAAFYAWRAYSNAHPNMDVAALMRRASGRVSHEEALAYEAPFPDARFKAGVRAFPRLVPTHPDAPGAEVSRRARDWWGVQLHVESFMAVGLRDPILGAGPMRLLRSAIRGCPPPLEVAHAGHFVQEDAGDEVARAALDAFGLAPGGG